MKQKFTLLLAFVNLASFQALRAQKSAFAVTGTSKGNVQWTVIREVDLETGDVIRTVYDPAAGKPIAYKNTTGNVPANFSQSTPATANGVAALAYDKVHNRLYFANMFGNELQYFDFNNNDMNVVVNDNAAFNTGSKGDEGNILTRMAFAADGRGYAITNDGKNFIRFTTDQKPTVANLGPLIDGKKNDKISVHSQCSSWGGDMVGDVYGNLYLVTYRNNVFKINPETRVADFVGQVKGLPADFTTNGVVVESDGDVVVSSATSSANYYKVNIPTLTATPVAKGNTTVYNSSDLANSKLLFSNKSLAPFANPEIKGNQNVSIYPNPAVNKSFSVQFDKLPAGKYNLQLTDASGRSVISKMVVVNYNGQLERMNLPGSANGGVYLIKLTGGGNRLVYNDKIVVQ